MKKILLILGLIFLTSSPVLADSGHSQTVESALGEIRQSQGIEKNNNIDCAEVNDLQFEELGEAVMSLMHPDEKEHELMDQMMGGEGSDSLKARHIMMGQSYLNCFSDSVGNGMMGGGMMNGGGSISGMMGGWRWSNWLLSSLFWLLAILGVFYLIRSITKEKKGNLSALEVLENRYAQGEIDEEEFKQKKKDLTQEI